MKTTHAVNKPFRFTKGSSQPAHHNGITANGGIPPLIHYPGIFLRWPTFFILRPR